MLPSFWLYLLCESKCTAQDPYCLTGDAPIRLQIPKLCRYQVLIEYYCPSYDKLSKFQNAYNICCAKLNAIIYVCVCVYICYKFTLLSNTHIHTYTACALELMVM